MPNSTCICRLLIVDGLCLECIHPPMSHVGHVVSFVDPTGFVIEPCYGYSTMPYKFEEELTPVYWRSCFCMVVHLHEGFNDGLAYVSCVYRERRECATLAKHRAVPKDRGLSVAAALIFISCVLSF